MMTNVRVNILLSFLLICFHLLDVSSRVYFLALLVFLITSSFFNKSVLVALWHTYLTIFPFQRSRDFLATLIPVNYWGGVDDGVVQYFFRFSDLLLIPIIYMLLRNTVSRRFLSVKKSKKTYFNLFLLIILAALSLFAAAQSNFFSYAFYQAVLFILNMSLFFISSLLILKKQEMVFLTVGVFALHIFFVSVMVILQFLHGSQLGVALEEKVDYQPTGSIQAEEKNVFRPRGYFFDPNAAGTWIVMILPLVVYTFRKSWISQIFFVVSIIALILTKSRTSWIVEAVS